MDRPAFNRSAHHVITITVRDRGGVLQRRNAVGNACASFYECKIPQVIGVIDTPLVRCEDRYSGVVVNTCEFVVAHALAHIRTEDPALWVFREVLPRTLDGLLGGIQL